MPDNPMPERVDLTALKAATSFYEMEIGLRASDDPDILRLAGCIADAYAPRIAAYELVCRSLEHLCEQFGGEAWSTDRTIGLLRASRALAALDELDKKEKPYSVRATLSDNSGNEIGVNVKYTPTGADGVHRFVAD